MGHPASGKVWGERQSERLLLSAARSISRSDVLSTTDTMIKLYTLPNGLSTQPDDYTDAN